MRYVLIDTANMFFRARHGAHRASDTWEKVGFALHVTLMAANKVTRRFQPDHVIFALEGRSWRKDYYAPYKANRAVARGKMNETEAEEDKLFWETYDELTKYLSTKTNCSVIRHPTAEADDIIARWIALHPQDEHVIVSSDTDFIQLVSPNVKQFNGITDELHTLEGILDAKDNQVIDKKTKQPKTIPDPAWLLFEKCMRGDTSDNVFSAYPGVRWTDHTGAEHRVLDDYERNRVLVDLNAQPQEIKDVVDTAICEQISHKDVGQVGSHFLRFCGKYELTRCSDSADQFGRWLNETYKGVLNDRSQTRSTQSVLDTQEG